MTPLFHCGLEVSDVGISDMKQQRNDKLRCALKQQNTLFFVMNGVTRARGVNPVGYHRGTLPWAWYIEPIIVEFNSWGYSVDASHCDNLSDHFICLSDSLRGGRTECLGLHICRSVRDSEGFQMLLVAGKMSFLVEPILRHHCS